MCLSQVKRKSGSKDTMRSSKSRSRSKTNRPRSLGNIINRVFDSSGPEGKVRGTPAQLIEKYQFLARDAQLSNDRVAAENFLQHAEHYTRMLAEATREMAAEQESRQQYGQQNSQASGQGGSQGGSQGGGQNGGNNNGHGNGHNQQRDRQQGERDQRGDRGDFRPEFRSEYRDAANSDQPVITSHDIIDDPRFEDAGLVETPEAAPRPQRQDEPRRNDESRRGDEPRRNDRPRFDRPRDENRRSYPPRVEQALADRSSEAAEPTRDVPVTAAPAPAVVAETEKPAPKPKSAALRPRAPKKPPVEVADKPAEPKSE
jgi:Domain of unknown function (DUF4167)